MLEAEALSRLVELQAADRDIVRLRGALEAIPLRIEALRAELEAVRARVEALRRAGSEALKKRRQMESELRDAQEKREKLLHNLHAIKTNREYTAALTEIESCKATVQRLEDAILEAMEDGERGEREMARQERELAVETARVAEEEAALESEMARLQGELAACETRREGLAAAVPPEILGRYEKIRSRNSGLAVVPLDGGVCGGCFQRLPPQVNLEVRSRGEIIYCAFCGRMLYPPGEGTEGKRNQAGEEHGAESNS